MDSEQDSSAQVASLRKDLDAERKRTERLDQLLLTNANLRKKLQDELHDTRQRCDALSVEVEGLRGTASVDVAKATAEAHSYKQLYFKSLEEMTQLRSRLQEQETLAAQAADERDTLQRRFIFQEEQLNQFSPTRNGAIAAAMQTVANISEMDEEESIKGRREQLHGTVRGVQDWLLGPPDEVPADDFEDDNNPHGSNAVATMERLDAHEVQRVVVGLYRRLKASEIVLGEVNLARYELTARNVQLQRELEQLQRKVAGRSPYGIRRDAGSAVASRSNSGRTNVLRPVSAPRRVPSADFSRIPSNAPPSRTASATRRPVSSGPRFVSPATAPSSAAPSARSASGASRGPPVSHKGPSGVTHQTQRRSPLLHQVRQEEAHRQHQLQQAQGQRSKSPVLRKTLPVPSGSVLGLKQHDTNPVGGAFHRVTPPPRLALGRTNPIGLADEPPVIVRRAAQ